MQQIVWASVVAAIFVFLSIVCATIVVFKSDDLVKALTTLAIVLGMSGIVFAVIALKP